MNSDFYSDQRKEEKNKLISAKKDSYFYYSTLIPRQGRLVEDFIKSCTKSRGFFIGIERKCKCLVWASAPSDHIMSGFCLVEIFIAKNDGGNRIGCQLKIDNFFKSLTKANIISLNRMTCLSDKVFQGSFIDNKTFTGNLFKHYKSRHISDASHKKSSYKQRFSLPSPITDRIRDEVLLMNSRTIKSINISDLIFSTIKRRAFSVLKLSQKRLRLNQSLPIIRNVRKTFERDKNIRLLKTPFNVDIFFGYMGMFWNEQVSDISDVQAMYTDVIIDSFLSLYLQNVPIYSHSIVLVHLKTIKEYIELVQITKSEIIRNKFQRVKMENVMVSLNSHFVSINSSNYSKIENHEESLGKEYLRPQNQNSKSVKVAENFQNDLSAIEIGNIAIDEYMKYETFEYKSNTSKLVRNISSTDGIYLRKISQDPLLFLQFDDVTDFSLSSDLIIDFEALHNETLPFTDYHISRFQEIERSFKVPAYSSENSTLIIINGTFIREKNHISLMYSQVEDMNYFSLSGDSIMGFDTLEDKIIPSIYTQALKFQENEQNYRILYYLTEIRKLNDEYLTVSQYFTFSYKTIKVRKVGHVTELLLQKDLDQYSEFKVFETDLASLKQIIARFCVSTIRSSKAVVIEIDPSSEEYRICKNSHLQLPKIKIEFQRTSLIIYNREVINVIGLLIPDSAIYPNAINLIEVVVIDDQKEDQKELTKILNARKVEKFNAICQINQSCELTEELGLQLLNTDNISFNIVESSVFFHQLNEINFTEKDNDILIKQMDSFDTLDVTANKNDESRTMATEVTPFEYINPIVPPVLSPLKLTKDKYVMEKENFISNSFLMNLDYFKSLKNVLGNLSNYDEVVNSSLLVNEKYRKYKDFPRYLIKTTKVDEKPVIKPRIKKSYVPSNKDLKYKDSEYNILKPMKVHTKKDAKLNNGFFIKRHYNIKFTEKSHNQKHSKLLNLGFQSTVAVSRTCTRRLPIKKRKTSMVSNIKSQTSTGSFAQRILCRQVCKVTPRIVTKSDRLEIKRQSTKVDYLKNMENHNNQLMFENTSLIQSKESLLPYNQPGNMSLGDKIDLDWLESDIETKVIEKQTNGDYIQSSETEKAGAINYESIDGDSVDKSDDIVEVSMSDFDKGSLFSTSIVDALIPSHINMLSVEKSSQHFAKNSGVFLLCDKMSKNRIQNSLPSELNSETSFVQNRPKSHTVYVMLGQNDCCENTDTFCRSSIKNISNDDSLIIFDEINKRNTKRNNKTKENVGSQNIQEFVIDQSFSDDDRTEISCQLSLGDSNKSKRHQRTNQNEDTFNNGWISTFDNVLKQIMLNSHFSFQ